MIWPSMIWIAWFFAGAFLCNSLPHLAAGLQGRPFPSPFATPPGVGNSSPLVNVLWGMFNVVVGLVLLSLQPVSIGLNAPFAVVIAGATAIGVYLALHFGKVLK
jgi:hypothetical protein